MYKQIKLFGHPIHPMLVAFPIAFYNGALASFITYAVTFEPFWFKVGFVSNVAGLIMAGAASFPGFIDLVHLPEDSAVKKTGFKHAAFNAVAFILFFFNALLIMGEWNSPGVPSAFSAIVLCALGVFCTICAGFLGWKMVQRHHVGVDLTPEQKKYEPVEEKVDEEDKQVDEPTKKIKRVA